jgi:hypothetical protein
MRTAWSDIEDQAKGLLLDHWDREVFKRLERSIVALEDELWLWKLIQDEKSEAADKVISYPDKP